MKADNQFLLILNAELFITKSGGLVDSAFSVEPGDPGSDFKFVCHLAFSSSSYFDRGVI